MVNKFNNFTITYPEWKDVDIEIPQLYYCGIFFDAHTMVNKFNNFTITYPEWQDDDIEIPQLYYCGIFLMLIPWLTNSTTLLLLTLNDKTMI